ncbi:MAG: hypothetical protein GY947_21410 [Rhodobacteraceae bacterium]|nr:hypothetical protein [Paracoccaceae bacterium]
MPTPLEIFFEDAGNFGKPPSLTSFAIGTDNKYDSSLLDYIEESYARGFHPRTLARWLRHTGAKWTKGGNVLWVNSLIKDVQVDTCCIAHTKCIEALVAIRHMGINSKNFVAAYKGNRKATYDEVVAVLEGGFAYLTLFDLDDPLAVLKRG